MSVLSEERKARIKRLRQHFEWFGLTAYEMRPDLTLEEWNALVKFSELLVYRMRDEEGKLIKKDYEDEWPDTNEERWEALK